MQCATVRLLEGGGGLCEVIVGPYKGSRVGESGQHDCEGACQEQLWCGLVCCVTDNSVSQHSHRTEKYRELLRSHSFQFVKQVRPAF